MVREWPLVGRREEAGLLAEAVADPNCGGAVIAGAAGVGKTRLALAALDAARAEGMGAERVQATRSSRPMPFGALAPLLPVAVSGAETQLELLQRFSVALAEHAGGRRWVLLIDDAHWLDDASAALVQQLAAARRVFVIATLRSGEPFPDAVGALWKDGYAERVDLQPLAVGDVDRLLSEVLGAPLHRAAARALWEACRGFPLYLRELVLGALAGGVLVEREGVWVLSGGLEVPPRLAELLDVRLAAAPPDERHALELLAVSGGCGQALLEELAGYGVVARLEARALVEVRTSGRRRHVQTIHPLYADLVSARLPEALGTQRKQQFAAALGRVGGRRRGDALQIAAWSVQAGAAVPPDLLLRGASEAYALFHAELAGTLARRAWEEGCETAAVIVAGSLLRQARHGEIEDVVRPMHEAARDERVRAELAELRADNLRRLGRTQAAREVLEAESGLGDPALRARLALVGAAMEVFGDGTPSSALRLLEPLLVDGGPAFPGAAVMAANALTDAARPREALELLVRAETAAAAAGAPPGSWREDNVSPTRAHALLLAAELHAAEREALATYERAVAEQDADGAPIYAALAALTAWWRGRVATAARVAREGLAVNGDAIGRQDIGRWLYGLLALAEASAGRAGAAARAVAAGEHLDAISSVPTSYDPELVHRGRAWSAVAAGRLTIGRRLLEDAAAAARRHERHSQELPLLYDVARLGHAAAVHVRIAQLADTTQADLAQHLLAHVKALRAEGGVELEAAGERLAAIGASLVAAEAFAGAARRHDEAGLARRASTCRRRMQSLLEECEGARTPALAEAVLPDRLTPRELEVATLAVRGLQSKEIAAALVVSVRTVNNLLQRVYIKLGVSGRAELRVALGHDENPQGADV